MPKKVLILLSFIFSLSLLPSCHYISKKSSCKKMKSKKACGGKARAKKACCGKAQAKKACCGQSFVAGQAHVLAVDSSQIKGQVFFEPAEDGQKTKVSAQFKGLKANQKFGFHVHEFGICGNKALLAGGHFNPWNKKHGQPTAKEKHLGDLGNLSTNNKGEAVYSALIPGRLNKFLGRSVVVHAKPDDFKTQPTGASGERIACGVIVASLPPAGPSQTKKSAVKEETSDQTKPAVPAVQKTKAKTAVPAIQAKPAVKPKKPKATVVPAVQKPAVKKQPSNQTKPAVPAVQKTKAKNAVPAVQPKPAVKKQPSNQTKPAVPAVQ